MSYIDDITNTAYNYVVQRFAEEEKMAQAGNGGALRKFSGETVENLVHMIWTELAQVHKTDAIEIVDVKGDDVALTVTDSQGNSIDESVDRHCFINGKLVVAVECKTYLDKCYMQRADSDFDIMRLANKDFISVIVSIEDSIKNESFDFFMNRGHIDKVLFLADGKRSSKNGKQIYKNPNRLNKTYFRDLVTYFDSFIK